MELNLIKSNYIHGIITANNLLNDKTLKASPWDQKGDKGADYCHFQSSFY